MRIKTIKRNTNYLLKMIDQFASENKEKINNDIKELDIKSKTIKKAIFDIVSLGNDKKNSTRYKEFVKALDSLSKIIMKKFNVLMLHDNHFINIQCQISLQSDMAIRYSLVLLNLENCFWNWKLEETFDLRMNKKMSLG